MNRILKNVIDAPKQDLFIKVLDNLPPSKDATDAESILTWQSSVNECHRAVNRSLSFNVIIEHADKSLSVINQEYCII